MRQRGKGENSIRLVWQPIAVVQGGAVQFVRADHVDRPVFATNAAGDVVWAQAYDPFGRVVSGLGSDARFAGQWFAAENGLHQNWMRDYDPTLGRYIQADPLGLVDGASVYGYALQNPARWSDPRGEQVAETAGSAVVGDAIALLCRPVIAATAGMSSIAAAFLMAMATPMADGTCGQGCFANENATPIPPFPYPHDWDGNTPPAPGWEWKGTGDPQSNKGNWVGPDGTKLRPDFDHPEPIGPHIDVQDKGGNKGRWKPDGTVEPKKER